MRSRGEPKVIAPLHKGFESALCLECGHETVAAQRPLKCRVCGSVLPGPIRPLQPHAFHVYP